MPQSIISQFSRAYNSPIEVNRQVATATERDAINSSVRWEGMLVYVVADGVTYELAGGISNGDWRELGGLQDAPSDGQIYGRKDGNWELIPSGGIQSVVAGTNIAVDNTDPDNPVVSSPNSVTSTPFGFDNRLIKSSGTDRVVQSTGITISDTNDMVGIEDISADTGVFSTSLQSGSFIKSGATSDDVLLGNGTTTSLNGIKTSPGPFDNGTTEIILEGSSSGAYTVGSQSWRWFRSHDLVFFFMNFNNINGTTPTGRLRVDISGSTFPPPDSNGTTVFNVHINDWPTAEIYSAYAIEDTANYITILVNTGAATSSGSYVIDMDFTGTTDIFISGIYRTTN